MPFPDRIVDAASRASAHHASSQVPTTREVAGNGTHIPSQVSNARAPYRRGDALRRVELTPHEKTVRDAILDTGAPERAALAWTMETYIARAATPEAREAVTRRMEAALAARGRDVAKLHHAGINVLDSVLTRAAWTTLLAALPGWASSALTAGQLARSVFTGRWSSVAAVLPSLAVALPPLRSHEQFDALVQSLPDAMRTCLWSMHEAVADADAQLRPNLGGGQLAQALAVAALLWQLQRALPRPAGPLQGVAGFIAELPTHWQRLAVLNGVGGAVLAPVGGVDVIDAPKVRPGAEEKAQRIARQRWDDQDRRPGPPRIRPTIDGFDAVPFDAVAAPGGAHVGSAIRAVPVVQATAAAAAACSPASSPRPGWFSGLVAGLPLLKGAYGVFQSVPQAAPPMEMTLMGESALSEVVSAATPLMSAPLLPTATEATRTLVRRAPLAAAWLATLGGVGGAALATGRWLWPETPAGTTPGELAAQLAGDVVALPGGIWGTGLDLLLGELEPAAAGRRVRRAAPGPASAHIAEGAADLTRLHGVSAAQLDALRSDAALLAQLQSRRRLSVAVARDIATHPGWEWVARLPATEQELLVGQWQALRDLRPALDAIEDGADAAMRAALRKVGFQGDWQDIEVRLPSTRVAGMDVDDRLPLLQFCLARAALGTPTFLRGGVPLAATELAQLTRFAGSTDARRLRADITARTERLRPQLSRALQARLVVDALKAKASGVLGSGNAHRRGADVVLGFLQGSGTVERSSLTYVDRLANGAPVTVPVPNYLVLRSVGEPGLHGQVVLYRSDLSRFQAFGDEQAFRQFLDTQRARIGAFAEGGRIDGTLAGDVVGAAAPAQRAAVADLVRRWEERLARHQSGQQGPQAWNPGESFQLHFVPVDEAAGALQQWADALVDHGQQRAQQQLDRNLLRWSPLGIANVAAERTYRLQQDGTLQTLRQHAHDSVADAMKHALRLAGFQGGLDGFDPDRLRLRVGSHEMALTDWATSGWQRFGLRRPSLPVNVPDLSPHEIGLPNTRLDPAPWLEDGTLDALQLVAYQGAAQGTPPEADALTATLQDPALRRAICVELEAFADSNRLADAYIHHLQALPGSPRGAAFADALANQLRARSAWMIETARQDGALDAATHAALTAAHAALDADGRRPSSLQAVTLRGHVMAGMWALRTATGPQVFLPDTAQGDRLLDDRGFRAWLRQPGAEAYIRARTQYRHHPDLAAMFEHTSARRALPVDYAATRGPQSAAAALIAARIDDVDEMTVSQLERFAETFSLVGAVGVGAICSLASAGSAAAVCLAGTLGLVAESFRDALDHWERGLFNDAILIAGAGLFDLLDPAQLSAIPGLMYQLGRRGVGTVSEAADAVRQWRQQARAFRPDGQVDTGLALEDRSLAATGLPMLGRPLAAGGTLYRQGKRSFIRQGGRFVEAAADNEDVLRLHLPKAPDQVGPPVEFRNNAWRRREQPPARRGTTTPSPVGKREWVNRLPEAENLPPEKLDELEAVFGVRSRDSSPSADLRHVVQALTIDQRIQRILDDPGALGIPGDEAIILRAWADSPALGNGKGVETYVETIGEWTRGARFGRGPVGLMVEVADTRTLPGIDALVDASDTSALRQRLKLPADSARDTLVAAVRAELARVIQADPGQSRITWQRWISAQRSLPTAADNLAKHFPELTKAEAEEIVARANGLQTREVESWIFSKDIRALVADTLTSRTQRQQRQAVVNDAFGTLADVQQLATHLQSALPGRTLKVRDDGQGGSLLLVGSATPGVAEARLAFRPGAGAMIVSDAQGKAHPHWQDALFEQLAASEKSRLGDASMLRREVVEQMKQMPIAARCSVRGPLKPVAGGSPNSDARPHERARRSADCDPPDSISLGPDMIALRDDMHRSLGAMRLELDRTYSGLRAEERELKALTTRMMQLKVEKQSLPPADAARMKELQKQNFRTLNGYDLMNAACYRLDGIAYDGVPLGPSPDFPDRGFALSTVPRAWMRPENFVTPVPVRRVFLPAAQAEGRPMQNDLFRADYPLGADLMPSVGRLAEAGQASKKITLTERDLQVTVPGEKQARSLAELTDAQFDALEGKAFSDAMRQYIGEGRLLASNARTLTPGDYYLYQIRSCSENKILKGWFDALKKAVPGIADLLDGKGPVPKVTGKVGMLSDSNPCSYSCDRRLAELMEMLPNVDVTVFYHFGTPTEALEWRAEQAVLRVMEKHRAAWEGAGHSESDMHQMAAAELKKPDVRQWADEQLIASPPERPVPRLWTPRREEEGF